MAFGWLPCRLGCIDKHNSRAKTAGLLQSLKWEQRRHWWSRDEHGCRPFVHYWGHGRLYEVGCIASTEMERSHERVGWCWRPWHGQASRMEVHKRLQISANAHKRLNRDASTRTSAASLRVNMLIGCVNLKHGSLRHNPTWQAPWATIRKPATRINPHSKPQAQHDARSRGVWRLDDSCAKKPTAWRPTTGDVPEPPTTCGTQSAFDLDSIRSRCRSAVRSQHIPFPCWRAVEAHANSNILDQPGATHVLADVSALIKGNNTMSPVSLLGLDAVSMTCRLL